MSPAVPKPTAAARAARRGWDVRRSATAVDAIGVGAAERAGARRAPRAENKKMKRDASPNRPPPPALQTAQFCLVAPRLWALHWCMFVDLALRDGQPDTLATAASLGVGAVAIERVVTTAAAAAAAAAAER